MGVDYDRFILILKLKLTLDDRKDKNVMGKPGNALLKQSITQIIIGILFALLLNIVRSPFTYYYMAHTFLMALMAMTIISEFSTILFDTYENAVIQPLPVNGNTVSLARNAHVLIYLTLMAFNFSILSIILAAIKFSIVSALAFVVTIILNVIFTLFLANILYLVIMHFASGEKLKNLLMYFQVAIAILLMAGYQFGMEIVDINTVGDLKVPVRWYSFLIPPAFFSGLAEALSLLNFDRQHLIFIAEAVFLPFVAIYFTGRYLTPEFNSKLMDLEQGDKGSKVKAEGRGKSLWYRLMTLLFTISPVEKTSFKLMWRMIGRERLFKQTLFPFFGYILIFIALTFLKGNESLHELAGTDKYLFLLYTFLLIGAAIPAAILTGNNRHAGWIFKSMPLNSPVELFKGFIKAAFARFFMPFYLASGIVVSSVWGISVLPDVLIALLFIYLATLSSYYIQRPVLPFSMEKAALNGGDGFIKVFVTILIVIAFGFLHKSFLHWFSNANLLLIPLAAGLIYLADRVLAYRVIDWRSVDRMNAF